MSKHCILMLAEYFPPYDRGGAEWSTFHLAKALSRRGHNVSIFTPDYGEVATYKDKDIDVIRFPYYIKLSKQYDSVSPFHHSNIVWWLWTTYQLLKTVSALKPHVLHVQGKYFIPQAVIVGKLFKIPVVVTLRDYIPLCPYGYCLRLERGYHACNLIELVTKDVPSFFKRFEITTFSMRLVAFLGTINGWFTSKILRFFLTFVQVKVGISQKLSEIYAHNHIPLSTTIYNTFSPPTFSKTNHGNYLLFVGRLTEGKGFSLLEQVYTSFGFGHVPKLKVIGEGTKWKQTSSNNNIEFLGHLPYKETLDYISQACLVIMPSVWEEPFGRVALEAVSIGVPVVVSNRGGLPEIVENGVTGIVVEPSSNSLQEGIKKALKEERKLRKNIRKLKSSFLQKFSVKPVSEYEKIYQSFL